MARTRIISTRTAGQPASGVPRRNWALKPIRFFAQRSVKTVMVNNPADGKTQPEFRSLLGGVRLATRNVRRVHQQPQVPPQPGAGTTSVRPARNQRIVKR